MLIHLNSSLFEFLSLRLKKEDTRPLLMVGGFGSGRFQYLQEYLRHKECMRSYAPFSRFPDELHHIYLEKCGCLNCVKIVKNKSADLTILNGTEKIDEIREAIAPFRDAQAVEFSKKYLVLRNLDYFPQESIDSLLKLIEEPSPLYEILGTVESKETCPPALGSRMVSFTIPPWTQRSLQELCENSAAHQPHRNNIIKSEAQSPYELSLFISLIEPSVDSILKCNSMEQLHFAIKKMLQRVAATDHPHMSLYFIMRYYVHLVDKDNKRALKSYFHALCESYRMTLFNNLGKLNTAFSINMESQLFGFFATVLAIKKKG